MDYHKVKRVKELYGQMDDKERDDFLDTLSESELESFIEHLKAEVPHDRLAEGGDLNPIQENDVVSAYDRAVTENFADDDGGIGYLSEQYPDYEFALNGSEPIYRKRGTKDWYQVEEDGFSSVKEFAQDAGDIAWPMVQGTAEGVATTLGTILGLGAGPAAPVAAPAAGAAAGTATAAGMEGLRQGIGHLLGTRQGLDGGMIADEAKWAAMFAPFGGGLTKQTIKNLEKQGVKNAAKYSRPLATQALDAGGRTARKTLSMISGVPDDVLQRYNERPKQIESFINDKARESGLYASFDDLKEQQKQLIDDAKLTVDNERVSKSIAESNLDRDLRNISVPDGLVDDVNNSMDMLLKKSRDGSTKAFDRLITSKRKIQMYPFIQSLTKKVKSFNVDGVPPVAKDGAYKDMRSNINWLVAVARKRAKKELGGKLKGLKASEKNKLINEKVLTMDLPAEDVKHFLQMVDEQLDKAYATRSQSGGKITRSEQKLMAYRNEMDAELKKIPGYREEMEKVASATRALNEARGYFGGDKTRRGIKKSISKDGKETRDSLLTLQKESDADFMGDVADFETRVNAASDAGVKYEMKKDLPEAQKYNEALANLDKIKNESSPVTGINNPQTFLKSAGKGHNYANQNRAREIDEKFGMDFLDQSKDLNAALEFEKDLSGGRGKRWELATVPIAAAIDPSWHSVLMGAMAGNMMNRYSPWFGHKVMKAYNLGSPAINAVTGTVAPRTYNPLLDTARRTTARGVWDEYKE